MNLNKVMCWESANKGLKILNQSGFTAILLCYDK